MAARKSKHLIFRLAHSPTKAAPQTLTDPPIGTTIPGGAGLELTMALDPEKGPGGVCANAPGPSAIRLMKTSFLKRVKVRHFWQAKAPVVEKRLSRIS